MKHLTLIPFLALTSACIKQNDKFINGESFSAVSAYSDNSVFLKQPSDLILSLSAPDLPTVNLFLRSLSSRELSKQANALAQGAFESDSFELIRTIALGTPVLGLDKETRINLDEALSSYPLNKEVSKAANIKFQISSKVKEAEMEFYLVSSQLKKPLKLHTTTLEDESGEFAIIEAGKAIRALADDGIILVLPKRSLEQNLVISDGKTLASYKVDNAMSLAEILKQLDPSSVMDGVGKIKQLFFKVNNERNQWELKSGGGSRFAFYGAKVNQPEVIAEDFQMKTDHQEKELRFNYDFKLGDKLVIEFKNLETSYIQKNYVTYYADELFGKSDYGVCTAEYVTYHFWALQGVKELADLNVFPSFGGAELKTTPVYKYHHSNGVKSNYVKAVIVEIQMNQKLVEQQDSIVFKMYDTKAKMLPYFRGCLVNKYPHLIKQNNNYLLDYRRSTFHYKAYVK